ncbi:hypothetical protein SI65_09207 [Aspergillus cristatus]|uniref:Uncharacterized protein n=1 Tax=Aspergillus cristatus TaxID=573508 RepID=A0A1E3B4A3_ASPCR|nr:hypothetical protein SI65_09207 [Aspergillus cristatus]
MNLPQLPKELLQMIAEYMVSHREINHFCQTNREIYKKLIGYLYWYNTEYYRSDVLQWGAIHGRADAVRAAIRHGADVNTSARISGTTLPERYHYFCPLLQMEMREMVQNGEQFVLLNGDSTPLLLAAGGGCEGVVQALLEGGADYRHAGSIRMSPLHAAAAGGHAGVIEIFLKNADFTTDDCSRALGMAATYGHVEAVETLIRHGADHNGPAEHPALISAARQGHVGVIRTLLDHGADIRIKNRSALLHAIEKDHPDVVLLLLERGEDIESRDYERVTPLMHSVRMRSEKVFDVLIELGADINVADEDNQTLLWWAREKYKSGGPAAIHIYSVLSYLAGER